MNLTARSYNRLSLRSRIALLPEGKPIFEIDKKGRHTILYRLYSFYVNVRYSRDRHVEDIRALLRYQDWDGYNGEDTKNFIPGTE